MGVARDAVAATVGRLRDAGAPTELRVATRRGAFGRRRFPAAGPVWRLGVLCLDASGAVFATGEVLVVTRERHPNYRSADAVERNALRGALVRAGVAVGTTVVLDARPLDLDAPEPPLVAIDDGLGVLWTAGGASIPLDAYLAERADLLVDPPAGA